MEGRSPLTDLTYLACLTLGAWALLLGYVTVPSLLSGPFWDGGISVLGALLAAGHLADGAVRAGRRARL